MPSPASLRVPNGRTEPRFRAAPPYLLRSAAGAIAPPGRNMQARLRALHHALRNILKTGAALTCLGMAIAAGSARAVPANSESHDASALAHGDRDQPTLAKACKGQDPGPSSWAVAAPPQRIWGNTWYVGTCGISAVLVTSPQGDVLIDAGVPAAAPLVLANIRKLGRDPHRVRLILATHEHYDHVGALAAIRQATGAQVAALPAQARALATGTPEDEDPQAGDLPDFEPVNVTRTLHDGVPVTMASLRFTPHATPVHAPGSTSWTWQSCQNGICRTITYLDSASTISATGYRFTDHPQRVAAARRGLETMAAMPCGILITPHPFQSDEFERLTGKKPLYDPSACRRYAASAGAALTKRLASEGG